MDRLIIRKNGNLFKEITLDQEKKYSVGRDPSSDIPIDKGNRISRRHCEIYFEDTRWIVTLNSKYGRILYEGDEVQALELEDKVIFSIPPYTFQFLVKEEKVAPQNKPNESQTALSHYENINSKALNEGDTDHKKVDDTLSGTEQAQSEDTMLEKKSLTPFLTVIHSNRKKPEIIELTGSGWTIGRDPTCEVSIKSARMSRRHFDLTKSKNGFYVTDLESANGTIINDETIAPLVPSQIYSGDTIKIMDLTIRFEVRDKNFEKRMAVLPATEMESFEHLLQQQPGSEMGWPSPASPPVVRMPSGHSKHRKKSHGKKNKIRLGIGLLLLIIVVSQLEDEEKPKPEQKDLGSVSISLDELTPTKRKEVEHHLLLARSHFERGKYELCMGEINKIHIILPPFETSAQVKQQCQQGSLLQKQIKIRQQREEEEKKIKQEVLAIVKKCTKLMNRTITMPEMEKCLFKVQQLDPGNLKASELLNSITIRENAKTLAKEKRSQLALRVNLGVSKYKNAKRLYRNGQLRKSIFAYQKFLNSYLPDPQGYRPKAKRELASVQKKLTTKVKTRLSDCSAKLEKGAFKGAIESCDLALQEDPINEEAKSLRRKVVSNMRKYMKTIYEDSVLEESFGNIEAAKSKWRQILKEDVESDSFFIKATSKLKKYGEGI